MTMKQVRSIISKSVSNIPGWRTKQHLIVIESDDWGSIRMPSREAFSNLLTIGDALVEGESLRYNKYDSLATDRDLSSLFEVLYSIKDSGGMPVIFTPVAVVANPDFQKILESDFTEYFYEPFTTTLKRNNQTENAFDSWKKGIEEGIFKPQFHGREHLNVEVWMRALRGGNSNVVKAFHNGMWGISTVNDVDIGLELQAAFNYYDQGDLEYQREILESGLTLFENIF